MAMKSITGDLTWAKIDLFTIVDRIEICLFDGFDEFVDTENITADVAEKSEKTRAGLVDDSIAQITARINDAGLKNDIEHDIDQFIEGIDTLWTPIDCLVGRIESDWDAQPQSERTQRWQTRRDPMGWTSSEQSLLSK